MSVGILLSYLCDFNMFNITNKELNWGLSKIPLNRYITFFVSALNFIIYLSAR